MSLPQHITFDEGGTVFIDLPDLPTTVNVSVTTGEGQTLAEGIAATVSTVDTTLTNAAAKGAKAINVASNTGIAQGGTIHVKDDPEELLVRKVDGAEVSLRRPLTVGHVTGAEVEGARVTASINAQVSNTLFWDGRCEWLVDGVKYFTGVECTKYPLQNLATEQDILDIEPSWYHLKDDEVDTARLLDLGLSHVLKRIAVKAPDLRTRVFPASMAFRHVTALAALRQFFMRQRGEEARDLFERYTGELEAEIDRICGVTARDADQDGVVEPDERVSMRNIRLSR